MGARRRRRRGGEGSGDGGSAGARAPGAEGERGGGLGEGELRAQLAELQRRLGEGAGAGALSPGAEQRRVRLLRRQRAAAAALSRAQRARLCPEGGAGRGTEQEEARGPGGSSVPLAGCLRIVGPGGSDSEEEERRRKRIRLGRFNSAKAGGAGSVGGSKLTFTEARAWGGKRRVTGSSSALEKPYFRLTSAPALADVRPPTVLRKALAAVREKVASGEYDYPAACEQFKSIRQDLTVQKVAGKLAVAVYEEHARLALTAGDFAELGQCLGRLKALHRRPGSGENEAEFVAYRLLHSALRGSGAGDALLELRGLPEDLLRGEWVRHALRVVVAVRAGDPANAFFPLLAQARGLLPRLLEGEEAAAARRRALRAAAAAFQPSAPLGMLARTALHMGSEAKARDFVLSSGAVLTEDGALDARLTRLAWAASRD